MDAMRKVLGISRKDKIRNEIIKERMEIEDSIIQDIEKKQLMYGHVNHMNRGRLPRMAWNDNRKREGEKEEGIPQNHVRDRNQEAMNDRNLQEGQWNDRRRWIERIGQRRKI